MKNLLIIINLSIIIGITTILTQTDSFVSQSNEPEVETQVVAAGIKPTAPDENYKDASEVSIEVQDFLNAMVESRVVDLEKGNTASQRATTRPLKNYGILMVKDQTDMLKQLNKIAARKNISVSLKVGPDKADGLGDLKELHGKDFDKKFIRMMITDHKKDLKKLQRAIHSDDADIQVFATRYLPIVESHLEKIKTLKKN